MCRVACLEWFAVNKRLKACELRPKQTGILLFETPAAKEAKNWFGCYGNHLGCCAEEDLQCGLSGYPVLQQATLQYEI